MCLNRSHYWKMETTPQKHRGITFLFVVTYINAYFILFFVFNHVATVEPPRSNFSAIRLYGLLNNVFSLLLLFSLSPFFNPKRLEILINSGIFHILLVLVPNENHAIIFSCNLQIKFLYVSFL